MTIGLVILGLLAHALATLLAMGVGSAAAGTEAELDDKKGAIAVGFLAAAIVHVIGVALIFVGGVYG